MLPVLTSPDIVRKAVAGVLSGNIELSMSTVQACLVLANSIGVSHLLKGTAIIIGILHMLQLISHVALSCHKWMTTSVLMQFEALEKACSQYFVNKLQYSSTDDAFAVALLADHLGLSSLLEEVATDLVQKPWWDEDYSITCSLGVLLQMTPYKQDVTKRSRLLHHSKRGTFTELQVLQLLDRMDCHEDDNSSTMRMEG